jgi:hypothetical protein
MVSGDTQHPAIVMVIKTSTKIAIRKQTYKRYPQAPPGRDLIYPDFNLPILQTSFQGTSKVGPAEKFISFKVCNQISIIQADASSPSLHSFVLL